MSANQMFSSSFHATPVHRPSRQTSGYRAISSESWHPGWLRGAVPAVVLLLSALLIPELLSAQTTGTTRAVGTGVNGMNAGTSGTNPGVSSGPSTAGTASGNSGATLGSVGAPVNGGSSGTGGTNPGVPTVPNTAGTPTPSPAATLGSVGTPGVSGVPTAGTSGTNPGLSEGLGNPLNRNPANRSSNAGVTDITPEADTRNSTSRPTVGAATSTDPARDTLVTPDPSRDSSHLPTTQ